MNLPIIKIQSSRVLEGRFELPKMPEKKIKEYIKAWKAQENLLAAIQESTGLTFNHNIIDAYIANPDKLGAISSPIIIGGKTSPSRFPCLLAHELIHHIMENNNEGKHWHQKIRNLYPNEIPLIAHHIAVHAILKDILLKTKNTDLLLQDRMLSQKSPEYAMAWKITENEGYKKIINKLKN